LFLNIPFRTTHIYIDTVEPHFLYELCGLGEIFRFRSEYLRDDRAFIFGIQKVMQKVFASNTLKPVARDKLSPQDIGLSILRNNTPKSLVRNIRHRREG